MWLNVVLLAVAAAGLLRDGGSPTANATAVEAPRALVAASAGQQPSCQTETDVVLVIDASGAVDVKGLLLQQALALNIARNMAGGPARLGIVVYADTGVVACELSNSEPKLTAAISAIQRPAGFTRNAADALAKAEWVLMSGGRMGASSTILMVMAGTPANLQGMGHMAGKIKQGGIRLMIVSVGYNVNQDRPKEWCSWPEQHNAYFYPSFEGFPALVQKFIPELCTRLAGQPPTPPGGGGTHPATPGGGGPPSMGPPHFLKARMKGRGPPR
jgi:hypothetical protein